MTQSTAEDRYGPPGEEDREAARSWVDTGPHPDGGGGTSVPEGPVKPQSTSQTRGVASLAGVLCADPEMRFTQSGKAITKLRVAVTERVRDEASGKWSDGPTKFTDVTVWGRQGEHCMESLCRGDRVVVTGIWQEDRWVGRDGEWHSRMTVNARDVGPSLMFRQARVIRREEGSN